MYNRDKDVEKTDILQRLLAAMEELTKVTAKDDTARAMLDALKAKGAREVKEVPASDATVDMLHQTRTQTATRMAAATNAGQFNYTTVRRLNDAFRALQGDVTAFQRTMASSVIWGQRANAAVQNVRSLSPDQLKSPIRTYKQAENWLIDKLIAEKGVGEGMKSFYAKTTPDADKLLDMIRSGVPMDHAAKHAQRFKQQEILREVQSATVSRPTASGGRSVATAATTDYAMLARTAATVAIAAAPMVLGKIAVRLTDNQIEATRRRFGVLSPEIATSLVQYGVSNLQRDLRIAPHVSRSFTNLVKDREALNKTLEPIEVFGENLKNRLLAGLTGIANFLLSIPSMITKKLNELDKKSIDTALGRNLGALQGVETMVDQFGRGIPGLGAVGQGLRAIVGVDMQKALDIETAKTPAGAFAVSIKRAELAPPRRF